MSVPTFDEMKSLLASPMTMSKSAWMLWVALFTVVAAYWPTVATMVHVWETSDTYAHGWLIPPISLYLLYQMRTRLAQVPIRPAWWALGPLFFAGSAWMLAALADIQVVQQLMLISMLIGVVLLVMGWDWVKVAAFPLGFLYLAVPLGDGLTPHLVDLTADFVVQALRVTGIPVYREGNFFVIPSGQWSVVSGCSGMRYLMATITVGTLFAYLNYRSIWRRMVFIVVAILVAILANWLRAYGIVMIAHLSDMKLALGIDHYIYGWVFFGIVIFLLMTVGMIWSEAPAEDTRANANARLPVSVNHIRLEALLCALVMVHLWPYVARAANQPVLHPDPVLVFESLQLPSGWHNASLPKLEWTPHYVGKPTLTQHAFAAKDALTGIYVAWYGAQTQGAEVVHAANELVREKYEPWRLLSVNQREVAGRSSQKLRESVLLHRASDSKILVWERYWIGDRFTTSHLYAKWLEVKSRLGGRGSPGAAVLLYSPVIGEDTLDAARARLNTILEKLDPIVLESFERAARLAPAEKG